MNNTINGVAQLYADKEEQRTAVITKYEFQEKNDPLFNLRNTLHGESLFNMVDGVYVRLQINGELMMSDTHMERTTNQEFIHRANGRVLIAGLGLGLVLHNILDNPNVQEVLVVENNQDIIDLVGPKFPDPKLRIVCQDIFQWKPEKHERFDTIYFDIWPTITTDNLDQIRVLHNKFKRFVNRSNPAHWMNSWMKEYLQSERARERAYEQRHYFHF